MRRSPTVQGFTLIEVLVALSIVAVALLAGLKATGALAHNAQRQTLALLAQMCAENELARLRLQRRLPGSGVQEIECLQAQYRLQVRIEVANTPNPNFQRADVQVHHAAQQVLQLSTVVGKN